MPMQGPDRREREAKDTDALPIARRLAKHGEALRRELRRFPLLLGLRRERMPMVGWFDPPQLIRTGLMTVASAMVGRRSDRRILQSLTARRREFYDYTCHYAEGRKGLEPDPERPRDELWIDYVCDTGDGWNPTYAVAYAVAQPELRVRAEGEAVDHITRRGDLLVFGGDEVYPTPTREEYVRRLIVPYETAFGDAQVDEAPHCFAIPGNHDWYDGLSAFSRLFMSDIGGRWFAGWRTRQTRSYFALKLPGGWWLLASDGQLETDVDTPQIEYFRDIADNHMQPGDRAILCLCIPVWVYAHKYRQQGTVFDETDLVYLREEVFARRGIEIKIFLSGDLHHYRRHEEVAPGDPAAPIQKITAGGGGAFLHPTHDEDVRRISEDDTAGMPTEGAAREFELKAAYPTPRRSWRLSFGNVLFAWKNPSFGIVPAILYLVTCWLVGATVGYQQPKGPIEAIRYTAQAFSREPGILLWVLSLIGVFVMFTDTHSRVYRWLAGLAHAAVHWSCIFYIGWGSTMLTAWLLPHRPLYAFALAGVMIFILGWIVGSIVMGLYLLISLNIFGRHSEEAFSALKIEDYKHFLRLHVKADGTLTIYPIKIERVPRTWRDRRADEASATASRVVPKGPLVAELIEPPIVVPSSRWRVRDRALRADTGGD